MAFCVEHLTLPLTLSQGMKSILADKFFHFCPLSSPPLPPLLTYPFSVLLSSSSRSPSLQPKVRLQVHIGHYNPAERYSPPLRPHLSLSPPLSFSRSPASVWSLLVLRDKLLPSCLRLSLFISLFFPPLSYLFISSSVLHLFSLTPRSSFTPFFLLNLYLFT